MKDTKAHILQTAFKLFLQKSFKEVTMNEIVEETGLSKGAFYHYFTSKEELFKTVITHYYVELSGSGFSAFPQTSLKDFIDGYSIAVIAASKTFGMEGKNNTPGINYFLHLFDAYRMIPEFKQQTLMTRKTQLDAWARIISSARKSGEIKTPLQDAELANLFVCAGDGAGLSIMLGNAKDNVGIEMSAIWKCIYKTISAR